MGKAKLISAADARDEFTTFTGVTRFKQGQLPSGAPLERNGSFSARSAEAATGGGGGGGLSRAQTAAARVENTRANNPAPAADVGRSRTMAATPTSGGGLGAGPGMTRGLSLRYQKNNGDGPGAGAANGGATGVTRQMTQLNVRDRNELPLPPPPSQPVPQAAPAPATRGPPPPSNSNMNGNSQAAAGARLTEIYDDYLGNEDLSNAPPLPPNATERVAQWASKTTPGAPAPPSGVSSPSSGSPPAAMTNNDRLRQNVGVGVRRNNTLANSTSGNGGPAPSVAGSMRRKPSRKRMNGGSVSRAPSSYASRSNQDRSTVYDDEEEEGYVSGEYDDVEYGITKLRVKVRITVSFSRSYLQLLTRSTSIFIIFFF